MRFFHVNIQEFKCRYDNPEQIKKIAQEYGKGGGGEII